eukprot:15443929-Alexandrium_andersonii.AAC.1
MEPTQPTHQPVMHLQQTIHCMQHLMVAAAASEVRQAAKQRKGNQRRPAQQKRGTSEAVAVDGQLRLDVAAAGEDRERGGVAAEGS